MTGDQDDLLRRLRSLLPPWFGNGDVPILDAMLTGAAWALSQLYALYAYAKLQTRVMTATDGWLDLIAGDFFGPTLRRRVLEADGTFRARILISLFRPKVTRHAVARAIVLLTGVEPIIVEPARPLDCGAYGVAISGYGIRGAYGSVEAPFNAFVTAFLPPSSGIPLVAGYGVSTGGYNTPSRAEYASLADVQSSVTAQDIYDAVVAVRPAATKIWVKIPGAAPSPLLTITTEDGEVLTTEAGDPLFI